MREKRILKAKQYLEQLAIIDMNISQDLERLEEMKISAVSVGGTHYGQERVQTSKAGNRLCNDVTHYVSFHDEINMEINRFTDSKNQIIKEIRGLNDKNFINVLYKIYVQYKSLKVTAGEMALSYSYVVELHKKALKAFEETYKNLYYLT